MENIVVKKAELLSILEKNRDAHRAIFEEALEGFRKRVIERLDEMMAQAKANKRVDMYVGLQQPEDHTKEYDTVIAMLKMDLGEVAELNFHDFANYVNDDWGWRSQFLTTNAMYSSSARRLSESEDMVL